VQRGSRDFVFLEACDPNRLGSDYTRQCLAASGGGDRGVIEVTVRLRERRHS